MKKAFWITFTVLALFAIWLILFHPDWIVAGRVSAAAEQPFDHSTCQYPDRWTNPLDGCDNSDPAVPECIKAAYSQESEKQCEDAFVAANSGTAEKQQAITEHDKAFEQPEPIKECGK